MKRRLYFSIFFILLIFSNALRANNYSILEDSSKIRKMHYGISVSFNKCYSHISPNNRSNVLVKNFIDSVKSVQSPDNGFYIGFILKRRITKNLNLETGLYWKKYKLKTITLYYDEPHTYYNDHIPYHYTYEYYYACLPIVITYNYFLCKKISLNIGLGISSDIKMDAIQKLTWENSYYSNSNNFIKNTDLFNCIGNLGITVGDRLTKFSVYTNINYSLNGPEYSAFIRNNTFIDYNQHLYYYGFGINLTF